MKKLLLVFVVCLLCICAYANDTISNKKISIEFSYGVNDSVIISQIKDVATGTKFIKSPSWSFLTITAMQGDKKIDFDASAPRDDFKVVNCGDKIVFAWKNLHSAEMTSGFDIVATCTLKDENSYWDLEMSSNSEYGIERIGYPLLSGIDAQDGDEFLYPQRGGRIYTEFSDPKGFKLIRPCGIEYTTDMGFYAPGTMQLMSLTKKGKNDVSLYLCPEDKNEFMKTINITYLQPNNLLYATRHYADHIGKAGEGFKLHAPVNYAVVQGDWYNVAKKYRKWGIENNFSVFANGRLEDRTDLPDWFKYNNVWFKYDGRIDESKDEILASQKYMDMPVIVHTYTYSKYEFDTHYPNWVPVREKTLGDFTAFQEHNMHVMPYTNGHIVDINQSPAYKEYGDILLQKDEKGNNYYENWAADLGANNNSACIDSPYYDVFLNEAKNILAHTNYDSLYIDQIGAMGVYPCYNKLHNHAANNIVYTGYNNLIKDLRKQLSEIKGEGVPITTEDSSEAFAFDGWLRINDGDPDLMENPANMVIYSDYVVNFGQFYIAYDERDRRDKCSKIKVAMNLTKGYQMGWSIGQSREFVVDPIFASYFKSVCKAREVFTEYFNFGEMVRQVKYDCPNINSYYWFHSAHENCQETRDFKSVWSCSYNYKGKTMVCFTSIGDDMIEVNWEALARDLNLKEKKHTITQVYADGKKVKKIFANKGNKKLIKSKFTIMPYEVAVFIVD